MERWASCPRCERSLRLTEEELSDKRGFCAACDEQFEIRLGMVRDEEQPFRALAPVELLPVTTPPPVGVVEQSETGTPGLHIQLVDRSALVRALMVTAFVAVSGLSLAGTPVLVWTILPACVVWVATAAQRRRGDQLEIRDRDLVYRPALGLRSVIIALKDIQGVSVETVGTPARTSHIRLRWSGGETTIGRSLGHDEPALVWVADWLEQHIAPARPPGLTRPLPTD